MFGLDEVLKDLIVGTRSKFQWLDQMRNLAQIKQNKYCDNNIYKLSNFSSVELNLRGIELMVLKKQEVKFIGLIE